MAERLGVLAQFAQSNLTVEPIYTVPAATQAVVSSIIVCNRTASATTFSLKLARAGAADSSGHFLFKDVPIGANATTVLQVGITLGATDVLRGVQGAANAINYHVFGQEIS